MTPPTVPTYCRLSCPNLLCPQSFPQPPSYSQPNVYQSLPPPAGYQVTNPITPERRPNRSTTTPRPTHPASPAPTLVRTGPRSLTSLPVTEPHGPFSRRRPPAALGPAPSSALRAGPVTHPRSPLLRSCLTGPLCPAAPDPTGPTRCPDPQNAHRGHRGARADTEAAPAPQPARSPHGPPLRPVVPRFARPTEEACAQHYISQSAARPRTTSSRGLRGAPGHINSQGFSPVPWLQGAG
ncbi:predicted GPI-anchored protein 58 [Panthera tigris]|uniref:predicted GPI-anchored protein 58 n=1 Tax=Panthera tigris TaxID=9694 RepID=UPI001C6FA140|nr:predicted GPI-anchored protein 58 [Panthera tigris]